MKLNDPILQLQKIQNLSRDRDTEVCVCQLGVCPCQSEPLIGTLKAEPS